MQIKYADIEVTLSLMSKAHTLVYAWELPLVILTHGPGSVRIFGYQWVDSTKIIDPQTEYDRLESKYKAREQNETPPILAIYGQRLIIHQTLLPIMRDCVRMQGVAGQADPLQGYEPNAVPDGPRQAPIQERMAWLTGSQGEFGRLPGGQQTEAAVEAKQDDGIVNMTVALPPGLPVDSQGRLSQSSAEQVLLAMGVDPDPDMDAQETKTFLGDTIAVELALIDPDADTPLKNKDGHYSDRQLVAMFATLRATGYSGSQAPARAAA